MVTIQFTKKYDGYKKGDVITIPNNDAHSYIDQGVAKLKDYQNKMMRTQ